MNCPSCGSSGAYIGLNIVECASPTCTFFKKPELSPPLDPAVNNVADHRIEWDDPVWRWTSTMAVVSMSDVAAQMQRRGISVNKQVHAKFVVAGFPVCGVLLDAVLIERGSDLEEAEKAFRGDVSLPVVVKP